MAAIEIAALCGIVLQAASNLIQNAGNNFYKASADWTEFPERVKTLRRKHSFWLAKLTQYGMLSDTSLMETLSEAEASLNEEQARLSSRQSRYGAKWFSKMITATAFPEKIGLGIKRVIEGFDALIDQLEEEQKADQALERRMMRRAPTLAIRTDDRYVPLKISESRVYSALNDPLGPPVVLVHGFPGTGKSTLVRQIALHYHSTANAGLFERVVFVECGRESDSSTKQFDLLQQLGPNASQEQEKGESSSTATIRRRLSSFLKHQKLLIILDDVWEGEFLRRMVDLCGVGVRCLVTSQRGDLCQGLSFSATRIQIEDAPPEAAMEILASHVGFKNKQIPPHIQEVARKIVDETQGHPLALASISTAIYYDRSDDLNEWDIVYHSFLDVLRSTEDTATVVGDNCSRSFWSTMRLSVQSLEGIAQKLLVLVHMCAGPSVSEEVLQALYIGGAFQAGFETFIKARKELENRHFIKITCLDGGRSWSVHAVLKLFMEEEMRNRKESMFTVLAPLSTNTESRVKPKIIGGLLGDEDAMIQTAICALYFDKHFSDRAASKLNIPFNRLNSLRRNAIEPITRLLGWPVSERWTTASRASAKQVFWTYISTCALHNDGIVDLLAHPISMLPVLTALNGIASIEETCLLDANSQGFIKALFNLLEEHSTSDMSIAKPAARALLELSANELHVEFLISVGAVDAILRILSSKYHPDLEKSFFAIVNYFPTPTCKGSEEMIVKQPGTLPLLVKSLFNDDYYFLQIVASWTLNRLAASEVEQTKYVIIQFPGVIEQLISFLSNDTLPGLQYEAAEALGNLAASKLEETKRTIIQFPDALEQLIRCLWKDTGHPEIQLHATRALANLASSVFEETNRTIIQFPGVVEQLNSFLSKHTNPELQEQATRALGNLGASNFKKRNP